MAHRPDEVIAKDTPNKFMSHPEGQFAARCTDVVNFGEQVSQFPGQPEKLTLKCGIVFRTGEVNPETGEAIDVMREFTVSMGEKANLRGFLEAWRGKSYTAQELEDGAPLHKLVGVPALLTIEHKTSGKGRTYANIKAISGLPKPMLAVAPSIDGYERPEYFEEKKKAYADEARKFRARIGAAPADEDYAHVGADDDRTDDLPF